MKDNKKVLIIAYKFPPYEGIAARRWAKFAKYFTKKGIEVHVVTTNWDKSGKLTWNKDIESATNNLHLHIINTPALSLHQKFPFASKLIDKITFFLRYKIFKLIDEGHFWTIISKRKIEKIIKQNNIKHLIATGAPFSINCLAARLKEKHPTLKVIQDLRDPWIERLYAGNPIIEELSFSGKSFYNKNLHTEEDMLLNSDLIVTVIETLTEMYRNKNPDSKAKFITITNGYDEEDSSKYEIRNTKSEILNSTFKIEGVLNISFFGMLGMGRGLQLEKLAQAIPHIPDYKKLPIMINIFGGGDADTIKKIKASTASSFFSFYPFLPTTEIQYYMQQSDVHLSINADFYPYAYGTKIFDAFLYKKPTLLISPVGELSEILIKNKLGYHTDGSIDKTINALQQIITDYNANNLKNIESNVLKKYSIDTLSDEYIKQISTI